MNTYQFSINEEIARWVLEVYIKTHSETHWWVAFTNPTAGPWKTITALGTDGIESEIYRFQREEERPDLVIVNDELKSTIIIEAKDFFSKLVADSQMKKSIRVINEMSKVLGNIPNEHWAKRKQYKIIPAFLWYVQDNENFEEQHKSIKDQYTSLDGSNDDELLSIGIHKDIGDVLKPTFLYQGRISDSLELK